MIGEPISTERTTYKDVPATESVFWLYTGHPRADATWDVIEAQKDPMSQRKLGTSVQGEVIERQGHEIVKSLIRHYAVSHQPMMPLSICVPLQKSRNQIAADDYIVTPGLIEFEEIDKSEGNRARKTLSSVGAQALDTLNLDTGDHGIFGDCVGIRKCYKRDYTFKHGHEGMFKHLVRCRGMNPDKAKDMVIGLYKTLYF